MLPNQKHQVERGGNRLEEDSRLGWRKILLEIRVGLEWSRAGMAAGDTGLGSRAWFAGLEWSWQLETRARAGVTGCVRTWRLSHNNLVEEPVGGSQGKERKVLGSKLEKSIPNPIGSACLAASLRVDD
ncbi:hypothetical protein TIFTF001_034272 [Ficus carica]|uniref:Uncharacterized protein n=1 Tax=Ficus carica TaxID=3494 RepID=A0AA88JAF0_FICCA|nr:hypothetical protein TIFTF001_034272 [Ficus carica]